MLLNCIKIVQAKTTRRRLFKFYIEAFSLKPYFYLPEFYNKIHMLSLLYIFYDNLWCDNPRKIFVLLADILENILFRD